MDQIQFPADHSLTSRLRKMEWRVTSIHTDALKPFGLNMYQAMSLLYIAQYGNLRDVNQRSIERYLYLSNPGVSKIVSFLEKEGYVLRESDPKDSRSYLLRATDKGMEFAEELNVVLMEADREILSPLTEEEQETLLNLLAKI